jgi:membrane protein YqaA with SNARE-associated domain
MFNSLYNMVLKWAEHKHADKYLAVLSFAESSFFPIPVDVMLAPMVLSKPKRWIRLALIATIFSVLGGIAGYFIGLYGFDLIEPILHKYGYWDRFELARGWFAKWGIWVVFIAGFSPIPYKVFTIASGALSMALIPFALISLVGRGARFGLVAWVVYLSANKIKSIRPKWIEIMGW